MTTFMAENGLYPAVVTPMRPDMSVDEASLIRLLAWFRDQEVPGVVLAGTTGEGPSLAAVEKRDLVRTAVGAGLNLQIILGVATPSLTEAEWLVSQAGKAGASGILLLPPYFPCGASETAMTAWMRRVMDVSPIPVILYHYPQRSGVPISLAMIEELKSHPQFAGVKDSSGQSEPLAERIAATLPARTMVGEERLLVTARKLGANGSISGASNLFPRWVQRLLQGDTVADELLQPILTVVRQYNLPALAKVYLASQGVISHPTVRLPLTALDAVPRDVTDALARVGLG